MAMPNTSSAGKVREVARKVRGQPTSDGAGVRMTRVIGSQVLDSFDPFTPRLPRPVREPKP